MILDTEQTILEKLSGREHVTYNILESLGFKMKVGGNLYNVYYQRESDDLELRKHLAAENDAVREGYDQCYTTILHFPDGRYSASGVNGFHYAIYTVAQLKKVLEIHDVVIPELEKLINQTKEKEFRELKQLEAEL